VSSSNRPDIELALDVRSNERVAVLSAPDSDRAHEYPDSWITIRSIEDIGEITHETVVVIDRVDVSARVLEEIGAIGPRLLALAPRGVEQEKTMRRMVSGLYPWSEVWTLSTSFGKLLVTKDAVGPVYDRPNVWA